jgi:hypothetical protein
MSRDVPFKLRRPRTHEWIDQRSLALDKAIAAMIRDKPELLDRAKITLNRWIKLKEPEIPRALWEWQNILNQSTLEEILSFITEDSEKARQLRQSSPFCGILPQNVRLAILKYYETRTS